jgi:hypothetical protein
VRYTAQCVGAQVVAGALLAGALGVWDRAPPGAGGDRRAGGVCDALVELIGIGSVAVGLGAELAGAEAIASSSSESGVSVVWGVGMQSSWVGALPRHGDSCPGRRLTPIRGRGWDLTTCSFDRLRAPSGVAATPQ